MAPPRVAYQHFTTFDDDRYLSKFYLRCESMKGRVALIDSVLEGKICMGFDIKGDSVQSIALHYCLCVI